MVIPVRLIEVDVVNLQPPQRRVDALEDVLAREPTVVGSIAHRPVQLRKDLQPLASLALERTPHYLLRAPARVGVRGVKRRDAALQRRANAGLGGLIADLAAVRHPIAIGQLADLEAATTKNAVVHGVRRYASGDIGARRPPASASHQVTTIETSASSATRRFPGTRLLWPRWQGMSAWW